MFLLDHTKLKKGDIILSRRDDPTSEIVRRMSNSEFSHARLYVGTHSCIDSDGLGVQSENIQRIPFDKVTDVMVLRYYRPLPEKVFDDVINSARSKVGTEYSKSEARKSINAKDFIAQEPNRQFCTRFVAQAYFEAGYSVVGNPNYCTPNDIVNSNVLIEVEKPLKIATEGDIEIALEEDSLTKWQKEITYTLMKKIRELTGADLQDFGQIGAYLIQNPQYDPAIVKVLHESGYMTMWMTVRVESPHFYDYNLLVQQIPDPMERKIFALQQGKDEPEIRKRFEASFETNKMYYNQFKLVFFKTLRDLNQTLINESKLREVVFLLASRE